MNTSHSEYYYKQEAWEFFLGGIYSSTEHAIESIGKTLAPSRKSVIIDENYTTMLLDEMWMTEKPSEEYKKFINNSEENVE